MEVSVSTPSGRKPPIAENVKEMRQILEQLFSTKGKNAMVWRQLLQAINQNNTGSSQNHPVLLCVGALHGLISTDFTAKLINQPARATSLLRALDRALRSRRRNFNPNIQQVFAKILNKLSHNPILTGKEKEGKGGLLYSFVTSWKAFTGTKGIRLQKSSSVDNSDNLRQ
uniref:CLASP N-terminal domain-containing protein n=1 Tax=Ciona savignyi TaxID=51511 RepID=H2Y991_CIOSA